jgi:hypothetical protein
MALYRNIIRRAVTLSWQHKYLWFFGLFAAVIGSGGYEIVGQSMVSSSDSILWFKEFMDTGIFSRGVLTNVENLAAAQASGMFMFAFLLVSFLLVAFFFYWLATVSQIAIVSTTTNLLADKEHDFQKSFYVGTSKFWPVFLINILVKVAIVGTLILVNLPLITNLFYNKEINISWLYILSVIVIVPILLLFSFMMKYVIAYVVIKGDNLTTAFKRAWLLFLDNWLVSIEMAIILFFASFLWTICIIIVISVMVLPVAFAFYMGLRYFGFYASIFVLAVGQLIGLAVILLSAAFNTTFQIAAWTDLFVELTGRGAMSKLERLFGGKLSK